MPVVHITIIIHRARVLRGDRSHGDGDADVRPSSFNGSMAGRREARVNEDR